MRKDGVPNFRHLTLSSLKGDLELYSMSTKSPYKAEWESILFFESVLDELKVPTTVDTFEKSQNDLLVQTNKQGKESLCIRSSGSDQNNCGISSSKKEQSPQSVFSLLLGLNSTHASMLRLPASAQAEGQVEKDHHLGEGSKVSILDPNGSGLSGFQTNHPMYGNFTASGGVTSPKGCEELSTEKQQVCLDTIKNDFPYCPEGSECFKKHAELSYIQCDQQPSAQLKTQCEHQQKPNMLGSFFNPISASFKFSTRHVLARGIRRNKIAKLNNTAFVKLQGIETAPIQVSFNRDGSMTPLNLNPIKSRTTVSGLDARDAFIRALSGLEQSHIQFKEKYGKSFDFPKQNMKNCLSQIEQRGSGLDTISIASALNLIEDNKDRNVASKKK